LFKILALLHNSEKLKIEPSAAAAFYGPLRIQGGSANIVHVAWATGGLFLPEEIYKEMYKQGMELIK
jgi:D-serine dehydratase